MTPEQVEAILASNAKAIASNSNAIAETRREINSLYQISAELTRDRATMYDILRSLNEDRVRTLENLALIAESISTIAQTSLEQNELLTRIANALEQREE
jgi:hypothetical protein